MVNRNPDGSHIRTTRSCAQCARGYVKGDQTLCSRCHPRSKERITYCPRCEEGTGTPKHCGPCSAHLNRIIKRWLDGGDVPHDYMAVLLGITMADLYKRVSRVRAGK